MKTLSQSHKAHNRMKQLVVLGCEMERDGDWFHDRIESASVDAPIILFTWAELRTMDDETWKYELDEIKDELLINKQS